jgi:hypothetical protein
MPGSWDPSDFPNLIDGVYVETSCYDTRYNCIAWAANDTTSWWQPGWYWPNGAPSAETIWAYAAAFATRGYVECANPSHEDGWEKIALFAVLENGELIATHAARQLPDGQWTSKLGDFEDITHTTLEAVFCDDYGVDLMYMKRPRT